MNVELKSSEARGYYNLRVADDDAQGFGDLAHAYTLFAETPKRRNPEQRGRFNVGEKLVLACCSEARVSTTTGTIVFDAQGRRRTKRRRQVGSEFVGLIRMTRQEYDQTVCAVNTLLPPDHVTTRFNGEVLEHRQPLRTLTESLQTEIAEENGFLRRTSRKTTIDIHRPRQGEAGTLFEMGIPVVETGDGFHVNIGQKVPLNTDRDNVTPGCLAARGESALLPGARDFASGRDGETEANPRRFDEFRQRRAGAKEPLRGTDDFCHGLLAQVRVLLLNGAHDLIEPEEAGADWVHAASSDGRCSDAAITTVLDHRFGKNRVSDDPSDPEAGNRAFASGYSVVKGRMLSAGQWDNAKRAHAVKPAGQVFPCRLKFDGEWPPMRWEDLTEGMQRVAMYAVMLAKQLMQVDLEVAFLDCPTCEVRATYGKSKGNRGTLVFYVRKLGRQWFDLANEDVDRLLLHELAHNFEGNYLDHGYHKGICLIGARLKRLALSEPGLFAETGSCASEEQIGQGVSL